MHAAVWKRMISRHVSSLSSNCLQSYRKQWECLSRRSHEPGDFYDPGWEGEMGKGGSSHRFVSLVGKELQPCSNPKSGPLWGPAWLSWELLCSLPPLNPFPWWGWFGESDATLGPFHSTLKIIVTSLPWLKGAKWQHTWFSPQHYQRERGLWLPW